MAMVTLTFDLEDNRSSPGQELRFARMTERFMAFLDDIGARGTFFVVGELSVLCAGLIRDIAAAGHEIALHGLRHVALGEVGPGRLREELQRGRMAIEDISGVPVSGFRAPIFSLTPATAWAIEEIQAVGFEYSSSVLPGASPLHGWPGAPRTPFRWPGGLLELPCPLLGKGRYATPFLGGVYLRYLPRRLVAGGLRRLDEDICAWSYMHPYDLDVNEPFFVLPHAGWLTSRIVHARRGNTLNLLRAAVEAGGGAGPPLGHIAGALSSTPRFGL
jgi:polysaccharide deacetylase family protein (PEP-CTERM system associated)